MRKLIRLLAASVILGMVVCCIHTSALAGVQEETKTHDTQTVAIYFCDLQNGGSIFLGDILGELYPDIALNDISETIVQLPENASSASVSITKRDGDIGIRILKSPSGLGTVQLELHTTDGEVYLLKLVNESESGSNDELSEEMPTGEYTGAEETKAEENSKEPTAESPEKLEEGNSKKPAEGNSKEPETAKELEKTEKEPQKSDEETEEVEEGTAEDTKDEKTEEEMLSLTVCYSGTGGREEYVDSPVFQITLDDGQTEFFSLENGAAKRIEKIPSGASVTARIDAESPVTDWTLGGESIGEEGSSVSFTMQKSAVLYAKTSYPEIAETEARVSNQAWLVFLLLGGWILGMELFIKRIRGGG